MHAQGLREWQAFIDCKKTIDVFLEELPLFQSLAHKSMRPRCAPPACNLEDPASAIQCCAKH